MPKNAEIYECKKCDFSSCKESNYTTHLATRKHEILKNSFFSKNPASGVFNCDCGKNYKHRQSLNNHKKKCKYNKIEYSDKISNLSEGKESNDKDIVIMLIEQNAQLQKDMVELSKVIETHYHTTNNKVFNLNFFLNETCKDAMNISEFVESIQVQLQDMDNIGNTGFVNGISDIIIKELKGIDVTKRPLHCSDVKRETMYVRDEDKWNKDDDKKTKINKMINEVSCKNLEKIPEWKKLHPQFCDSISISSGKYENIILSSLDSSKTNNDKIIKSIAKEIKI
jgi:hypothetical protein|tara:strand:- start:228 stop:1073 length:846 start_codon:yes stop_codon:yes gene_type:complete